MRISLPTLFAIVAAIADVYSCVQLVKDIYWHGGILSSITWIGVVASIVLSLWFGVIRSGRDGGVPSITDCESEMTITVVVNYGSIHFG